MANLKKCIEEHCKNCIVDEQEGNGTWRQQVQACTATACALYEVRPLALDGIKERKANKG